MTYNHTFEIIIKDIQDIEKLVSNFNNYSHIPKIELDLALSKLRNLYDLLLMYRDLEGTAPNDQAEKVNPDNQEVNAKQVSETTVPEKELIQKETVTKTDDLLLEADKKSNNSDLTTPVPNKYLNENTTEIEVPKDKKPAGSSKQAILSERFTGQNEFINEKLGANTKKGDISSRHSSSPIQSIAGSIGVNDKFLFIRELFDGDAIKFRESMSQLDSMPDFSSAQEYLKNNYQWNMEDSTVKQLLSLIHRKYISSANE